MFIQKKKGVSLDGNLSNLIVHTVFKRCTQKAGKQIGNVIWIWKNCGVDSLQRIVQHCGLDSLTHSFICTPFLCACVAKALKYYKHHFGVRIRLTLHNSMSAPFSIATYIIYALLVAFLSVTQCILFKMFNIYSVTCY